MKFFKHIKSGIRIMVLSIKILPLKVKLKVRLWKSRKAKIKEMKALFASLQEEPYEDTDEWIRLFDEYETFMTKRQKQFYIDIIQDIFADPEDRRTVFGEAIGEELYSDAMNFLQSIPRDKTGLEKLCRYLEEHSCMAGYKLLFEEFAQLLSEDEKLKAKMVACLMESGRSIDYLQDEFPELFKTTEVVETATDEEIWMSIPEIRALLEGDFLGQN